VLGAGCGFCVNKIALLQSVEVLQGVDGALRGIVEKEAAHGVPSGEGGGAAMERHVADRLGDGEVDPRHNAVIKLCPLNIEQALLRVDGAVDMIQKIQLAKCVLTPKFGKESDLWVQLGEKSVRWKEGFFRCVRQKNPRSAICFHSAREQLS
jgi:hypothetical protein